MLQFPSLPELPGAQRAEGSIGMRYEDISQDGALKVGGMPHAVGMVCFRHLWLNTPQNQRLRSRGVVPILSRLVAESLDGPVSVSNAFEVQGGYHLAHSADAQGQVQRLILAMQADLFAPRATTHDPQPEGAGTRQHVGRVHAEHVFTRPFGPVDQRKVLALDLQDGPHVPPAAWDFQGSAAVLDLPPGAQSLESAPQADPAPLVFGLAHTDSNQHVNSLVYPQLFEDAALRSLARLGHDTSQLLAGHVDIRFRKPCFAGQRVGIWLRAFSLEGRLGVYGWLGTSDAAPERAHCTCRLLFK